MSSELVRIARLAAVFESGNRTGISLGIGDDAAVLEPGGAPLVLTIDAAVEGVHFRRAWLSFEDVGWRSLMAAASDLAAMGARPRGVVCGLVLPADVEDEALDAIARGQAEAARAIGTAVIGGNLSRGGELSITTAVLGEAARPLVRSGARPGDAIAVAGPCGLARAGMLALASGRLAPATEAAVAAWRRPTARIAAGLAAAEAATAAIDVSDGLSIDVSRLAEASSVRVVLDEAALRSHGGDALTTAARAVGEDPLETALEGGEDYAVVIAVPPGRVPPGFTVVGACESGRGLALRRPDGEVEALTPKGFDHFRR